MMTPRAKIVAVAICTAMTPSLLHAADQDTLVVSATGFEQKIQNAPASISVISKQQIEDKAYRDVTDALKDVPGVVVTGGASSSDISIRGMGSQYTLFLVNGKRISTRGTRPNSDNAGIEQGWLPPLESIERIEVIRGPMSSPKKCRIPGAGAVPCMAMRPGRRIATPAIFIRPMRMRLVRWLMACWGPK